MDSVGPSGTGRRVRPYRNRRPAAIAGAVVIAAAAVLSLAGCLGSAGAGSSVAGPTVTQSARPYTDDERALYGEAVRRVESFDAANQRVLAVGRPTRDAKLLYKHRLWRWHKAFAQLRLYEQEGIKVARAPVVLSTRPVSIKD